MKEIIAKKDKKTFLICLIFVIVSIIASGLNYKFFENFGLGWFVVVGVSLLGVMALLMLVLFIITPNNAIEREGDNLIVYPKLNKRIIPISSIISFGIEKSKDGKNEDKIDTCNIILKINVENKEESVTVINVKDKLSVLKKLESIVAKSEN